MKYRSLFVFLFIFFTAFLVYSNSLKNEFVFDDAPLIVENHEIREIKNIPYLLGFTGTIPYYRPIRIISYVFDYYFFKLNPEGYHISNIIYHIITAWIMFLIVRFMTGSYIIAVAACLLFTVHPVNTESVSYISGRRDILSTLFYLLGFFLFLKYRQTKNIFLYPLIILSYILGILSKEMAVTLPVMFLIYDLTNPRPASGQQNPGSGIIIKLVGGIKKHLFFYLPFITGAAGFIYYKIVIRPPSHGHEYYGGYWWTNLLTVAKIITYYLKLLVLPVSLNADYSFNAFPVTDHLWDIPSWGSLFTIIILILISIKCFKKNPVITFSAAWFFITLLPVCHIIPHHELMAEHYLYLPSIGFFIIASVFIYNFIYKKSPVLFFTFLGIIIILFSIRTFERNKDWKDALTLWEKTVITAPGCARAWNNLGVEYYNSNKEKKAENCYRNAINIKPDYSDPYHNLGNIMVGQGLFDIARQNYMQAYKYSTRGIKKIQILNSWGILYKQAGKLKLAEQIFRQILRHNPFYQDTLINMAAVLYSEGKYWHAWGVLMKALRINPDSHEARNNLGSIYKKTGNMEKAAVEFRRALQLKPDFMEAYNNLGNVLKAEGKYDEAIEAYRQCLRIEPGSAAAYTNMGSAFRKSGQNEKAIASFKKALVLDPETPLAHLNLAIIYLSGKKDIQQALFHLKKTIEIDPFIAQADAIREKIEKLENQDDNDDL